MLPAYPQNSLLGDTRGDTTHQDDEDRGDQAPATMQEAGETHSTDIVSMLQSQDLETVDPASPSTPVPSSEFAKVCQVKSHLIQRHGRKTVTPCSLCLQVQFSIARIPLVMTVIGLSPSGTNKTDVVTSVNDAAKTCARVSAARYYDAARLQGVVFAHQMCQFRFCGDTVSFVRHLFLCFCCFQKLYFRGTLTMILFRSCAENSGGLSSSMSADARLCYSVGGR